MSTSAYLSSARTSSLVMLVAVVVGYQLASSFARQASLILDARKAFATVYLQRSPYRLLGVPNSVRIPGIGRMSTAGLERPDSSIAFLVAVHTQDNRRWGTVVGYPVYPDTSIANDAERTLHQIAREIGVADPDEQNYTDTFVAIERPWSNRDVKVPGIDLGFRADVAPWIIALAIVILLIMIDNQVRTVLGDPDLASDVPWLVLDARGGLEKLVAGAWLLAVALAPWLAGGSVILMFAGQVQAAGLVTPVLLQVLAFVTVLALLLTGGWVSLTVVSRLLHLRRLRQLKQAARL